MRIVVDTNVIVSALLSDAGAPAQVLDLCMAGDLDVVLDARVLGEYRDVLHRPEFGFNHDDVDAFFVFIHTAEAVVAAPLPLTLADPDDAPFMEVAVAAAVDAIVTGNVKHFRPAEGKLAIPVPTPRQLLDKLAGR